MIKILAVLAFALAVIFNAWSLQHGAITWQLLALIGLFLLALAALWDRTPW
jgi:hypothetical protein